jgi:hypothetical protein
MEKMRRKKVIMTTMKTIDLQNISNLILLLIKLQNQNLNQMTTIKMYRRMVL